MVFSTKSLLTTLLQSSAALAATINVNVGGNGQLIFSPTTVNANVGDTIKYTFLDLNHTVTAGNPNQGCQPSGKFNSGFVPVAAGANTKPTFSVAVTNTQPITVYCAQAQHCQVGMVMVINPAANGATSLSAYQQLCAQAATNTAPKRVNGGVLRNANSGTTAGAAASTTSAATKKTGKGRNRGGNAAAAAAAVAGGAGTKKGLAALFGRQAAVPTLGAPAAAPSAPCPPPPPTGPCLNGTIAAATNGTAPNAKGKGKGKKAGKKANKAAKKGGKKAGKKGKCAKTTLATVASLAIPSVSAIPLPSVVSAAATPSLV